MAEVDELWTEMHVTPGRIHTFEIYSTSPFEDGKKVMGLTTCGPLTEMLKIAPGYRVVEVFLHGTLDVSVTGWGKLAR